jgi:hypothetical protein
MPKLSQTVKVWNERNTTARYSLVRRPQLAKHAHCSSLDDTIHFASIIYVMLKEGRAEARVAQLGPLASLGVRLDRL